VQVFDLIVVGGGAAGFFGALRVADLRPDFKILLIESGRELLGKVKISGGGRCNVTHNLFDTRQFSGRYPRGHKELLGVFSRFQARDTIRWFEERGVKIKAEPDGRMFPVSNDSASIIHCFQEEARLKRVQIETGKLVNSIQKIEGIFNLEISDTLLLARNVLWATGGNRNAWSILEKVGHKIVAPVPSLFSFKLKDHPLAGLEGLSLQTAGLHLSFADGSKLEDQGPLLVTHWGVSGPAVLRASAWGARAFASNEYQAELKISVLADHKPSDWVKIFQKNREQNPRRTIYQDSPQSIPSRLWERFCQFAEIPLERIWAEFKREESERLSRCLSGYKLQISGRGVFKDEFVTAGGVDLKEVDFTSMQSKVCDDLYFAGEVINVDGVTGGFNFQNAWSTSWIAGTAIATLK